jgi:hypothetical protein
MTLGGYLQQITTFHTMDGSRPPFPVLVFVATPQSRHWLGPAPLQSIAKQVASPILVVVPYSIYKFLRGLKIRIFLAYNFIFSFFLIVS